MSVRERFASAIPVGLVAGKACSMKTPMRTTDAWLALYARPYSSTAKKYLTHALTTVARGISFSVAYTIGEGLTNRKDD